jgi:hypothetical protein
MELGNRVVDHLAEHDVDHGAIVDSAGKPGAEVVKLRR